MDDVTWILSAVEQGDAGASEQLLPLVYRELRKLAARRSPSWMAGASGATSAPRMPCSSGSSRT